MKCLIASAFVVAASLASAPPVLAQTGKPTPATATTTSAPPLTMVKMSVPIKGTAFIEVIQGQSKTVGNEKVTVTKVKNVSNGAIAGLRVDEFWYNNKLAQVSGDTQRVKTPIQPGQVVEVTTRSPMKPDLYRSQISFTHANGKIDAKAVKKFTDDKK